MFDKSCRFLDVDLMSTLIKNIISKVQEDSDGEEEEISLESIDDIPETYEDELQMEEESSESSDENMIDESQEIGATPTSSEETMTSEESINSQELEDLREQVESVSEEISKVNSRSEETKDRVEEFEEKMRKLYMIYEVIFKGVNPFEEEYDFEEDVHDVLDDFVSGGSIDGESSVSGEIETRIDQLENRIDKLEGGFSEGESSGLEDDLGDLDELEGEEEPEEDVEEDYKSMFEESEESESKDAKWDIGDVVMTPEGKRAEVTDRNWNDFKDEWEYRCKLKGE